jgi:4'-phosphopantetheinyl transferase EntD
VTGSIAHADGLCLVAVSGSPEVAGLGVDIEPAQALEPELWPEICDPLELGWITQRPARERGHWARVVFCAKEAFYKCQYAVTRARLTFSDVTTTIHPAGTFEARLTVAAGRLPRGFGLMGRYVEIDGWFVTAITCTRSDLDGAHAGG